MKALTYVDHGLLQIAGEIGTLSAGLEKNFTRYSLGGLYGVVPSEVSGGPVIETVTLRQTYRFYEWERVHFYTGLNLFHVLGLSYQSDKLRDAPDRYYPIGGVRALLNLGTEFRVNSLELASFYFEAGMNDIWIVNALTNGKEVNPGDHVSLGLGLKHKF